MCRVDDLTPEEDKHEIEYNALELKRINLTTNTDEVDGQAALAKTTKCCGLMKSKKTEPSETNLNRRGSIKQAGVISNAKKLES